MLFRTRASPGSRRDSAWALGMVIRQFCFSATSHLYKGLEYLIAAFQEILAQREDYRLIIAGACVQSSPRTRRGGLFGRSSGTFGELLLLRPRRCRICKSSLGRQLSLGQAIARRLAAKHHQSRNR